ncbi:MAG: DUF2589 domain-containing protein [Lachnospiraceae bacterium]|nr:DUF2589 domain-containing protein [Lachnospiraceae bacterium]
MAIAQQFAGLDMEQLIGAPLSAAAGASKQLADSTAEFINRVGFDSEGKTRTVAFAYQKRSMNEDGTSNLDEMKVQVPMLAIVPIPNLQVDEVNILFDMEVKQSEKSEQSMDLGATVTGSLNLGIFKVNVSGSVSAHSSNTRSSDNSAKYHVDVRATNHGTPEGLARVLDMMAANVAPMLVDSSIKDGDGKDLPEQARIKAENLKALRQEISQIESRLSAARDGLDTLILQLKKTGDSQRNIYQGRVSKLLNELRLDEIEKKIKNAENDDERNNALKSKQKAEEDQLKYSQAMEEINQSWSTFMNQAGDTIKLIADENNQTLPTDVSDMFKLMKVDENGDTSEYVNTETYYKAIVEVQNNAIKSQQNVSAIEKELLEKKTEYSDTVAGKSEKAE